MQNHNTPVNNVILSELKPQEKKYRVKDSNVPNLHLEVLPSGLKKWRLILNCGGVRRQITLGTFPEVGLNTARESAAQKLSENLAPNHDKDIRPKGVKNFGDLAKAFIDGRLRKKSAKSLVEQRMLLDSCILPKLGRLDPAKITSTILVVSLLAPLLEKGETEKAGQAKKLCRLIFRFGLSEGRVAADPTEEIQDNLISPPQARIPPSLDPMRPAVALASAHSVNQQTRAHHYHVRRNPVQPFKEKKRF
jgi:hypothetical protein